MYRILRFVLFRFSAEKAHDITFLLIKAFRVIPGSKVLISKILKIRHPKLERTIWGIKFPSPVGLAAGLDKNAVAYDFMDAIGFGFVEVGTATPKPQPGNPKPRLFRIVKDKAIINRMGFNNIGAEHIAKNLSQKRREGLVIGGNIGKNTATSNEDAPEDYLKAFKSLYNHVDYFVVNVSCPNVANLRNLQNTDSLANIVVKLVDYRKTQKHSTPILLKISPDLSFAQVDDALNIINQFSLDGIVAVNTTTKRTGLTEHMAKIDQIGNGGLSGKPLAARAIEVVRYISMKTNGQLPIIGVGGIMNKDDALNMLRAGAYLIQVYSGFIYQGPKLIADIHKAIIKEF